MGDDALSSPSVHKGVDSNILSTCLSPLFQFVYSREVIMDASDLSSCTTPVNELECESDEEQIDVSGSQISSIRESVSSLFSLPTVKVQTRRPTQQHNSADLVHPHWVNSSSNVSDRRIISNNLSQHDFDSSTNHSSVITPYPITLFERLDKAELPVRGNVIPTPAVNFDLARYLSDEFCENENSIYIHPLVSIPDPDMISIDGSLHLTADVTDGPGDVLEHIFNEDCPPPLPPGMSEHEWAGYIEHAFEQAVPYCPLLVPGALLSAISTVDLSNFKEHLLNHRRKYR